MTPASLSIALPPSALLVVLLAAPLPALAEGAPAQAPDPFQTIAQVLQHPRCRNCHPDGDRPLHGDPPKPHPMNVQRRLTEVGQACSTCHQTANTPGAHRPPGAPHWGLAPRLQVFEGRTQKQLCEALRSPATNGDRTLAALERHLTEDPLVLWGWAPGAGRTPVPVPQPVFAAAVRAWIAGGAQCK